MQVRSGRRLGGEKSPVVLTPEQRLEKLQKSAAFGGRHVPVPVTTAVKRKPIKEETRPRAARFRSVLDLGSKLNNETISSKSKKL